MAILDAGPCSAWDPVNCGPWPDELESVREYALMAATEVLWERTKRRFGLCEVTIRPCRRTCAPYAALSWLPTWGGSNGDWGWPYPALLGGRWYNLGCGFCENECSCAVLYQIELPTPVAEIIEIKINGSVLSSSSYRVDNWRWLVRLDGQNWPLCQDLNKADTEVDTWSVTATYGEAVPMLGMFAVNELGLEVAKTCISQSCGNPSSVTKQVVRQGVTKIFMGASKGQTGLFFTDRFINTYNPTNSGVATIYNIDSPKMRRLPPPPPPPPDPQIVDLGLVSGSGQVFSATAPDPQTVDLGLVFESGFTFSATPTQPGNQLFDLGLVIETDSGLPLPGPQIVSLNMVIGSGQVLAMSASGSFTVMPFAYWATDTATDTDAFTSGHGYVLPFSPSAFTTQIDVVMLLVRQYLFDKCDQYTLTSIPAEMVTSDFSVAQWAANPDHVDWRMLRDIRDDVDTKTAYSRFDLTMFPYIVVPIDCDQSAAGQCFANSPEGSDVVWLNLLNAFPQFFAETWGAYYGSIGVTTGAPPPDNFSFWENQSAKLMAHEFCHGLGYDPTTDSMLPHNNSDINNLMSSFLPTGSLSSCILTTTEKNLIKASPFMTFHNVRP